MASDTDYDQLFKPSTSAPAPPDQASHGYEALFAPTPSGPAGAGVLENLRAGIEHGVHEIADWPVELGYQGAEKLGFLPQGTAQKFQEHNKQYSQQLEQTHGGFPYQVGNIGMQALASIPLVATGEGAIGALGKMAETGLPYAGPAIGAASRFLTGAAKTGGWGEGAAATAGDLLTRGASRATEGALQGAIATPLMSGSGGPSTEDLARSAETGAILNPALGAAGSIIGGTVGPIVGPIAQKGLKAFVGQSDAGAQSTALAKLQQAAERDGMTLDQLATQAEKMGPGAMLADAGGINTRGLGAAIANSPGEGAQNLVSALETRAQDRFNRITGTIRGATGQSGEQLYPTIQDLDRARKLTAGPLYERAFAQNDAVNEYAAAALKPFIQHPTGQAALQQGLRDLEGEAVTSGIPFDEKAYGVTKDENGQFLAGPQTSLRLLDAVKRGYDDIISNARDPITGRVDPREIPGGVSGNVLLGMRTAYTKTLKNLFPDYAAALDAWAGPSRAKDMMKLGQNLLKLDPEVISDLKAGMTASDRDYLQIGLSRLLEQQAGSVGPSKIKAMFNSPNFQKRMAVAFDSPGAMVDFQRSMQNEAQMVATERRLAPSAAAVRPAQEDMHVDVGHLAAAALHHPGALIAQGARIAGKGVLQADDKTAPAIANLLTMTGPELRQLLQSQGQGPGLGRTLAGSTAVPLTLDVRKSFEQQP